MNRLFIVTLLLIGYSATCDMSLAETAQNYDYAEDIRPLLMETCGDCHDPSDEDDAVGFLRAETVAEISPLRELWESAAEQLRNRTMPPADADQPSEKDRLRLATWIEHQLEASACDGGSFAGNPVARRLNRDQYTAAIEDLTGVSFDFVEKFPADGGGGEGFDNNGETLFVPPLLMERYFEVAAEVTNHVMVTQPMVVELDNVSGDAAQAGKTLAQGSVNVPYRDWFGVAVWFPETINRKQTLVLKIDGIDADEVTVDESQPWYLWYGNAELDRGQHTIQIVAPDWKPGDVESLGKVRVIQLPPVQFVKGKYTNEKNERRRAKMLEDSRQFVKKQNNLTTKAFARRWGSRYFELGGEPLEKRRQATKRILGDSPLKNIEFFAIRAWRRQITDKEKARLKAFLDRGIERGESVEQAAKLPLQSILTSPKFLFVTEQNNEGTTPRQISDLELASRLSLFLWHSIPDDELLRAAFANKLHRTDVLESQVDRMLADPRSRRFAEAFAGQWLGTVAVGRTVIPDTDFFKPHYSDKTTDEMRRQVSETMLWMLKEDRPITDWIDSPVVVINKRLAEHYGIETKAELGDDFQPIRLEDCEGASARSGAFGMGAVHMLTSYARRTSPVLRGGWVLETMFGTHVPAPPPDIPSLKGGDGESDKRTVRQRLELHRANPTCAVCHDMMDPIGFAMENFDVLGRWRDNESTDNPIDASGKLPSGETFDGVEEMRAVLMGRRDDFTQEYVRRMLGYALGRSLDRRDACTISAVADQTKQSKYSTRTLVKAIVTSVPFMNRSAAGE